MNDLIAVLVELHKNFKIQKRICETDMHFCNRGSGTYFQMLGARNAYVRIITDLEILIGKLNNENVKREEKEND